MTDTTETEINGVRYSLAKLDALTQFHVMRRVMPIVGALNGGKDIMPRALAALGQLPDEDAEYVLTRCLSDCRRLNGDTWAKAFANGRPMYEDITMPIMLQLAIATMKEPLSSFFTGLASLFPQAAAA